MKKIMLLAVGVAGLTLTSCGGEKPAQTAQDSTTTVVVTGPLPADDDLTRHYADTLGNRAYAITIKRTADETSKTVTDEFDQEYYDNSVSVHITRDGAEFFSKTFTKEAFEDYLTAADSSSVLLGMAYDEDKSNNGKVCLAAQIGLPGTGEGPAFTIEIPAAGGVYSIVRDTQQDTNAQENFGN